jgi:myo-inositol-1(or 4)-monophosphatase
MSVSLDHIGPRVVEAARSIGAFIRHEARAFDRSRIEQKSGFNNLVSYVDKESERRLVAELSNILPGSGFLAEEGTEQMGSTGYRWIIDPLDGTTNFTHGFPPYAVSIGLSFEDEIVLGVVYEVHAGECFYSWKGAPVFCNEMEVKVAATGTLSQSLLATGFPYQHADKMDMHLSIFKELLYKTHGVRRPGSAATDLAYVACGRLDGFFEYNLSPWDVAAGGFLVQQAGGKVTDFSGGGGWLLGGQICCGNAIHRDLLKTINLFWK